MLRRKYSGFFLLLLVVLLYGCTPVDLEQEIADQTTPENPPTPTLTQTTFAPSASPSATATLPPPPSEPSRPKPTTQAAPTLPPSTSLDIAFIHMIDRETGWAIGGTDRGRDHILYTQDGARTFQDVTPPIGPTTSTGVERWVIGEFLDENNARVVFFPAILEPSPPGGADVVIWLTQNAGLSWDQSEVISTSVLGTQDFPPRLDFIDSQQGWFMGRNGGAGMHRYPVSVYRTQDGGVTWEPLIEALGGSELQSCRKTGWAFGDSLIGLATIDNCPVSGPAIEQTQDGGRTWGRIILPPPDDEPNTVSEAYCETITPQFIAPDTVVLGASCTAYLDVEVQRELFYRSGDNGQTWDAWDYPGGELLFLDASRGFALSREIYWTADGGVTWEEQKAVHWDGQFSFVDPDFGWAVARADDELALVATEDRGQTWKIVEPVLVP